MGTNQKECVDMYKISVPIINASAEDFGLEKHLRELERLGAKRVFLAFGKMFSSEKKQEVIFEQLKRNCEFFKSRGYEVGAWLWTFMISEENDCTHMTGINGQVSPAAICPSDENFRKFACDYIRKIAECGVDIIQFDDDFRYGHSDFGFGCLCENHLKYTESILGEKLTQKELAQKALFGGKNKYRTAWQKSKAYYFELFAKEIRKAVDEINPDIRISICACMSVWDFDGIDAASLSRILAGNTKPIMRLIGAPYWAVFKGWGNRLQNIIEIERTERSWCGDGIEIMSEGDCYPRPRTNCPANYLEIFDTALRASGDLDGILKYAVDYHSKPGYEDGYIAKHEKNRPLYEQIDKLFSGKTARGIRVYERMQKFEDMLIPEEFEYSDSIPDMFFSPAARMLADNSVPTVYSGSGVCGIAFAENVSLVPRKDMKKGLIIDLRAAEILADNGIDTGILSIGERYTAAKEYFDFADNFYAVDNPVFDIKINENAKILSHFISYDSSEFEKMRTPGSYYYKNADGEQFLVFAFYAYPQMKHNENISRSYLRSAEIKYAKELFGGEKLPAYSYGNPDLYILAKKNEGSLSVGLWNIFADEISSPVIELDGEYSDIEFANCGGRLDGNKVYLDEIPPYGIAAFEVKQLN